ncbi:MAG: hypothetical protein RLZZ28_1335 [Bacteroidota bacterium]|jgi:hypothetical protein
MIPIEFPSFHFSIKKEEDKEWIFDGIRKKWVRLTPEEWVRQNMIQYLIQVKKYPASLMAVEKEIRLGELKKRIDILVYKESKPWMIIECKETTVALSEAVIRQILAYHITLDTPYLLITNGESNFAFQIEDGKISMIPTLPEF